MIILPLKSLIDRPYALQKTYRLTEYECSLVQNIMSNLNTAKGLKLYKELEANIIARNGAEMILHDLYNEFDNSFDWRQA